MFNSLFTDHHPGLAYFQNTIWQPNMFIYLHSLHDVSKSSSSSWYLWQYWGYYCDVKNIKSFKQPYLQVESNSFCRASSLSFRVSFAVKSMTSSVTLSFWLPASASACSNSLTCRIFFGNRCSSFRWSDICRLSTQSKHSLHLVWLCV